MSYRVYVGEARNKEKYGWGNQVFVTNEEGVILDDKFNPTDRGVCPLFGPKSLQVLPFELHIGVAFGIADLVGHGPFGEYDLRKKAVMTPEQFEAARTALCEARRKYDEGKVTIEREYGPQIQELQERLGKLQEKMGRALGNLGSEPKLNDMILSILGLDKGED